MKLLTKKYVRNLRIFAKNGERLVTINSLLANYEGCLDAVNKNIQIR